MQQKRLSEALIQFNKALEFNPNSLDLHQGLGFCYFELGRIEESVEKFNYILKFNRDNEHAHFGLGLCYHRSKEFNKAISKFKDVLKINSSHRQVNYHLGLCYHEKKEYSKAIEQFKKALEVNPEYWHAHECLAVAYLEEGKVGLSLKELQQIESLSSQNETYHHLMSKIYLKQNKEDLALQEIKATLEINPDNEFACENMIRIYRREGRYDLAKKEIYRILKIYPHKSYLYQELGNIYLAEKEYSKAIEQFKKALKKYSGKDIPSYSLIKIYKDIGSTYLLMKKYKLAIEILKKAIELDPADHEIKEFISKAYIEMRDYDSGVTTLLDDYDSVAGGVINHQGSRKIKILRIPSFYSPEILSSEMNSIILPPLALASITSYLRSYGIGIDQDDLHIKIHYDNYFSEDPEKKIDEGVFFDEHRVIRYALGGEDLEIEKMMERASRKTKLDGYRIILFSLDPCSMNFSHAMFALCFARYLKKTNNPIIILGGLRYFPELMKKLGCFWPDIDYVVCNEGEDVLVGLLSSLLTAPSLESKGKADIKERVLYCGKVPKCVKPDFDGLPLERYKYRGLKTDFSEDEGITRLINEFNSSKICILPFKFIKGCTNKCIFCASSYGGLIHVVAPGTVVVWLDELQARYEPAGYLFLNDTLNISKKYLNKLCDEIIKRKLRIRWSDCVRVDRLDKDSIYKMRDAGCIRMVFGMETASKRLLKYINKEIDLRHLEDMLYWANKAGVWTGLEIITGLPHENEKDFAETMSFLLGNKENIDALYYNAFNIKDTSLLQANPARYGVTNVFELSNYEEGFATFVKYGFDEISGLKWPEKRTQIISNLNRIVEKFGNAPFPEHEYEHFLFFLYSRYKDKKTIKDIFYSVGAEKIKYVKALQKTRAFGLEFKGTVEKALSYGGRK